MLMFTSRLANNTQNPRHRARPARCDTLYAVSAASDGSDDAEHRADRRHSGDAAAARPRAQSQTQCAALGAGARLRDIDDAPRRGMR